MKAGKELENYVQFVYQKLLDFMDEGAMVSSNVSVIGKSGVKHEFDVYYEFQHLNMRHRIAIECKDWNTPVSKGEVGEFLVFCKKGAWLSGWKASGIAAWERF